MGKQKSPAEQLDFKLIESGGRHEPQEACVVKPGDKPARLLERFLQLNEGNGLQLVEQTGRHEFIVLMTRRLKSRMKRLGFEVRDYEPRGRDRGAGMSDEDWAAYNGEIPKPHKDAGSAKAPTQARPSSWMLSAKALGLKPGDWNDPDYRAAYARTVIISQEHSQWFRVRSGGRSFSVLEKFIERHAGEGLKMIGYDHAAGAYAVEVSESVRREMEAERFDLTPIEPPPKEKRSR